MARNFNYRDYVNQLVEENGTDIRKVNLIGMKQNQYGNVDVDFVEVTPRRKEKMSGYTLCSCTIDKETAPKVVIPAFAEVEIEFAKVAMGSNKIYINRFMNLDKFGNKEE